jgi:hypothetical protein
MTGPPPPPSTGVPSSSIPKRVMLWLSSSAYRARNLASRRLRTDLARGGTVIQADYDSNDSNNNNEVPKQCQCRQPMTL